MKHVLLAVFLIGIAAYGKTLTVGVAMRSDDKFNLTVTRLVEGIETAKEVFERRHPETKIILHKFGHGSDIESVLLVADKMIAAKIPAVIGGEFSDEALAFGDRLSQKKIVLVSHTATNPRVTENPYVFRVCFEDTLVGDQLASFVIDKLKPQAIGILRNISSPYSSYLSKHFSEAVVSIAKQTHRTAPTILTEDVLKNTTDFSEQIELFKKANVTHVALFTLDTDLIRFLVQAEKKKFFPTYIGSDGWGSNQYALDKLVKESPVGPRFSGYRAYFWNEQSQNSMSKLFRQAYHEKYGVAPNAWNAVGFDAAWVLFSAMKKAKNPSDGELIQKELKALKNIPLVTSDSFTFNGNHSPTHSKVFIYRIDKQGISLEAAL
ncbi:MAG: ABC transporter substrate-binding protein [Deltaproteobacteria bacterium]|nr:ABC transporter substrate-binding protein [Deltaproteobacteria bacterium]